MTLIAAISRLPSVSSSHYDLDFAELDSLSVLDAVMVKRFLQAAQVIPGLRRSDFR